MTLTRISLETCRHMLRDIEEVLAAEREGHTDDGCACCETASHVADAIYWIGELIKERAAAQEEADAALHVCGTCGRPLAKVYTPIDGGTSLRWFCPSCTAEKATVSRG